MRGLVIEGFGRGNVPAALALAPAIERRGTRRVLVGIATHCIEGGNARAWLAR